MTHRQATLEHILCNVKTPDGHTAKKALSGGVLITRHGIEAASGEKEHYPDPDCALMQYALEHYDFWRSYYPAHQAMFQTPGIFGENFSTRGMTEHDVCPGDIYQVGGAQIQVAWGREACSTMAARLQDEHAPEMMHQQSRNGWFYRVLEEGEVHQGQTLTLVDRSYAAWPLSRVQAVIFNPDADADALDAVYHIAPLSATWRQTLQERLAALR